jgi:hypothetical protein
MFVRRTTYDKAIKKASDAVNITEYYKFEYSKVLRQLYDVKFEVRALHARIASMNSQNKSTQFSAEEISKLIMLCHPDKHNGKAMANELTSKLIKLREASK